MRYLLLLLLFNACYGMQYEKAASTLSVPTTVINEGENHYFINGGTTYGYTIFDGDSKYVSSSSATLTQSGGAGGPVSWNGTNARYSIFAKINGVWVLQSSGNVGVHTLAVGWINSACSGMSNYLDGINGLMNLSTWEGWMIEATAYAEGETSGGGDGGGDNTPEGAGQPTDDDDGDGITNENDDTPTGGITGPDDMVYNTHTGLEHTYQYRDADGHLHVVTNDDFFVEDGTAYYTATDREYDANGDFVGYTQHGYTGNVPDGYNLQTGGVVFSPMEAGAPPGGFNAPSATVSQNLEDSLKAAQAVGTRLGYGPMENWTEQQQRNVRNAMNAANYYYQNGVAQNASTSTNPQTDLNGYTPATGEASDGARLDSIQDGIEAMVGNQQKQIEAQNDTNHNLDVANNTLQDMADTQREQKDLDKSQLNKLDEINRTLKNIKVSGGSVNIDVEPGDIPDANNINDLLGADRNAMASSVGDGLSGSSVGQVIGQLPTSITGSDDYVLTFNLPWVDGTTKPFSIHSKPEAGSPLDNLRLLVRAFCTCVVIFSFATKVYKALMV